MSSLYSTLSRPPYRYALFIAADIFLVCVAALAAFLVRFDGALPPIFTRNLVLLSALNVAYSIPIFLWQKLYTINLSFVSIRDLYQLLKGVLLVTLLELLTVFVLRDYGVIESFPRSTLLLNFLLSIVLLGSVRILKRMIRDVRRYRTGKRVLIIGA